METVYDEEYQTVLNEAVKRMCEKAHLFSKEFFELIKDAMIKKYTEAFKNEIGDNWENYILKFVEYSKDNKRHEYTDGKDDDYTNLNVNYIYNFDLKQLNLTYPYLYESHVHKILNAFINDDMFQYNIMPDKFYQTIDRIHSRVWKIRKYYNNKVYLMRFKYILSHLPKNTYFDIIPKDITQIIYNLL